MLTKINWHSKKVKFFIIGLGGLSILAILLLLGNLTIKSQISSTLKNYNLQSECIDINPWGCLTLTNTKIMEPSRFAGGFIEKLVIRFSPLNPKKIKSVLLSNFYIPINLDQHSASGEPENSGRSNIISMLPEKISFQQGSVSIQGRIFENLNGEIIHRANNLKGNISFGELKCNFELVQQVDFTDFTLTTSGSYHLSPGFNINELSCRGRIDDSSINGESQISISVKILSDKPLDFKFNFRVDLKSSIPQVEIVDYNLNFNYEQGAVHIQSDSFFYPLPENEQLHLIDYQLSGDCSMWYSQEQLFWQVEDINLNNLILFSPLLCEDTVCFENLNISRGSGSIHFSDHHLNLDSLIIVIGDSNQTNPGFLNLTAQVHYSQPYQLALSLTGSEIKVEEVINMIPSPLIPNLKGITGEGSFDFHLGFIYHQDYPESTELIVEGTFHQLRITSLGEKINIARLRNPFTTTIKIGSEIGQQLVVGPDNPNFICLDNLPRYVWGSVLICEDGGFWSHHGFSLFHLRRALRENLSAGHYISGGSTITMQLARNLFLSGDKTLSRKLEEAVLTWQLERNLTKKRILEIYLNIIEFGPGIRGIGEAAHYYFAVSAYDLTPLQAAYLATIIPNPRRYHRLHYEQGGISNYWQGNVYKILKLAYAKNYLDSLQYNEFADDTIYFRGIKNNVY
ncbi:MAG: hypothetical protein APR63_10665 [Desulfuromonas sp. SDB]|nr:MAG: hypothetical protein APR63_10665 [Desulfuromonas sp. SDB]